MAGIDYRAITDKLRAIFFPPRCAGCGEIIPINTTDAFCPVCRDRWEKHKKENCKRCGQPIDSCWCGIPYDKKGYISAEYHIVQYDKGAKTVIKKLLYNLKNYDCNLFFDTVAKEMYKELYPKVDYNDLVISYVPRSKINIKKYGHDQSAMIAGSLSKLTELPIAAVLIHTGTQNQKRLDFKNREENAEKSYHIINEAGKVIKNKTVILVDDVMTSGASVTRCAHLLKWKGAKRVIVFTVAKTV